MTATLPLAPSQNPFVRIGRDLRVQVRERGGFPPGDTSFDAARTRQLATDPLPILLDCYERHGPVFSLRVMHATNVFVLGPEANHYLTVSHASSFRWRDGGFDELAPLLGSGLLNIDGVHHRRARQIMLPAFHRNRIAGAADTMVEEIDRALARWEVGQELDLYAWARTLAMRIAMRALLGLDPDGHGVGARAAIEFENALHFFGIDFHLRVLRGPGTPWRRMLHARDKLDAIVYAEIARRRRAGPGGDDLLDMLLGATDDEGRPLTDREVRDQAVTLLFAGHDTTTSTISFLFYELARHPREQGLLLEEQGRLLAGRVPGAADLAGGLPRLEMVLDETLRLYPPAWIGPRRADVAFELLGRNVPRDAPVNYSSWASHRLPDIWSDPEAFVPERFEPDAKAALAKGAYVPFGGGSRTCIGMRFGQMEIRAITTRILERFRLELQPGFQLDIRQMPTLSPRHGMPMRVRAHSGVPASTLVD